MKTLSSSIIRIICITSLIFITGDLSSQVNIDTLAIQDFETSPATPTWTFTGPVVYNSGTSSASAAPPNSPIGIGGSRAWETTTVSGGLVLEFGNNTIPAGYDSVRFSFRLAAMNLNSSSGGPDHLDYVLVELSTDGGLGYYGRMRIRGATNNNSFWPYSATGKAKLYYQPASEVVFQPVNSGLQTTLGYSRCEIVFPGSISQVRVKLTGRSSSSSDTWLIDNVLLTGEKYCSNTTANITELSCDSFIAPSGQVFDTSGIFTDIIPNSTGCDSIITVNLTVEKIDTAVTVLGPSLIANEDSAVYQWLDCNNNFAPIPLEVMRTFNVALNGSYAVEIKKNGCIDTSACYDIVGIGIEQISKESIRVFPNPFQNQFRIVLPYKHSEVKMTLCDVKGEGLDEIIIPEDVSYFTYETDKDAGLYFLRLTDENSTAVIRILKIE